MSNYIEAHAEEETSLTSQDSLTRYDESDDQLPLTIEFKTDTDGDAQHLASTMKVYTESEDDDAMESDYSTASMATPFAIAQVQVPRCHLHDVMCNTMVHSYGPNPDPRVVVML